MPAQLWKVSTLRVVAGKEKPSQATLPLGRLELAGGHLAAALIALDLEGDLLALVEGTQARAFDGADVHEHVRAPLVGLDEAKALGGVEPLHSTGRHRVIFLVQ